MVLNVLYLLCKNTKKKIKKNVVRTVTDCLTIMFGTHALLLGRNFTRHSLHERNCSHVILSTNFWHSFLLDTI